MTTITPEIRQAIELANGRSSLPTQRQNDSARWSYKTTNASNEVVLGKHCHCC